VLHRFDVLPALTQVVYRHPNHKQRLVGTDPALGHWDSAPAGAAVSDTHSSAARRHALIATRYVKPSSASGDDARPADVLSWPVWARPSMRRGAATRPHGARRSSAPTWCSARIGCPHQSRPEEALRRPRTDRRSRPALPGWSQHTNAPTSHARRPPLCLPCPLADR
jgi:hypothetical protein